ncbi:hypothetical protein D9M70_545000 [compost metagenome]
MAGERARGIGLDVVLCAGRNVIEVDGRLDGVGDGREMADKAILCAGNEEGGDDCDPIDADTVEFAGELHRLEGCRHAGIDNHLDAAADLVGHLLRQAHFFL